MKYFKLIPIILFAFLFIKCNVENENVLVRDCIKPNVITDTVQICNQVWMTKNLDVDHYRNGDSIPEVRDSIEWANLTTGAWCYFDNNIANGEIHGKLYNWFAVYDQRGLAPSGWHVATDAEWKELELCLGMSQEEVDKTGWRGTIEGNKLKEAGITHWIGLNTGATNETGFTALPSGDRLQDGTFSDFGYVGHWWSSAENDTSKSWHRHLFSDSSSVYRINNVSKVIGFSVRCVRD